MLGAAVVSVALVVGACGPAAAESYPRYDLWQSPAGAVKCRMYMNGSMGQYTLACLVVASGTLVRWGGSYPDCRAEILGPCGRDYRVSGATSAQRAQFDGARRVRYGRGFGMGPQRYGYFHVYCKVSSTTGSTCEYGPDDPVWINFRSGRVKICAAAANYAGVICRRVL